MLLRRSRHPLRPLKRLAGVSASGATPCRNPRGTVPMLAPPPERSGGGGAASLDLDGRACGLELLLDLLGLLLRHALLDGLLAGLDEVLGLFQAEVRDRTD